MDPWDSSSSGPAESSECEDRDEEPGRPSEEEERSPSLVELRTLSSEPPDEEVAMDSVEENLGRRGATRDSGRSARASARPCRPGLPLNSWMALARDGRARTSSALSCRDVAVSLDMLRLEGRSACGLPDGLPKGLPLISRTAPGPCPWGLEARCGAERMDSRARGPWNLVGSGAEAGAEPGVGE